jgi:hypothetical protein
MSTTTIVPTPIGTVEVSVIDATHAHVCTPTGSTVEVDGEPYTAHVRFELVDGAWTVDYSTGGIEPVRHRDFANLAPVDTIHDVIVEAARQAVVTTIESEPNILGRAAIARADEAVGNAENGVVHARILVNAARRELRAAKAKLAATRAAYPDAV